MASAPSIAAPTFDLDALMTRLSSVKSGEATFVEQRFVRTLDAPLVSSGTLGFAAPDRFSRHTLKPRPESMSVEGNVVTVSRAGRGRTFTLDAAPELVGVVEAVRGTLTGNEALVRRYFKADVAGVATAWTLTLTPLESRVGAQVRQIVISGDRANVARIEMTLTDGDYSVMNIVPVSTNEAPANATSAAPGVGLPGGSSPANGSGSASGSATSSSASNR